MIKICILILLLPAQLAASEFRRFGPLEVTTQATAGAIGAGIGYLFLRNEIGAHASGATMELSGRETLVGLSVGFTLGVIFAGKIFHAKGNPFLTLAGNLIPFFGPLLAFHLSLGNNLFSDAMALFNLHGDRLTFGLPLPHRRTFNREVYDDTVYYVNLAMLHI